MRSNYVAFIVPNYNMPEAADKIYADLHDRGNDYFDLFLIDNGSDLMPPAAHTNVRIPRNCQTTGAFLHGIAAANKTGRNYIAYCFMITSAEFTNIIGIEHAINVFEDYPSVVGYSPALTLDSTTAWKHMYKHTGLRAGKFWAGQRKTWMIDNICAFWRKDWFDSIGQFDPRMTYAWGIDLETSWKARSQGRDIVIDDYWQVKKTTDIGYEMGRMNMSAEERVRNARAEMEQVLSRKYGPSWEDRMRNEFVTEGMR